MSGYGNYQGGGGYNGGGYGGGGGGGYGGDGYGRGGYGRGGYGGGRKRNRDDDQGGGQNYRRRQNERGDYQSSPRRGGYGGGGGGMAMGYDRLPSLETQKNRFKEDVWKLGDNPNYDPAIDIPSTAQSVETWFFRDRSHVFFTFRAAVSEMPHKLPHYAALLAHLSLKAVEPPVSLASRISANPTPASWPPPPADAAPLASGLPAKPVVDGDDAQMTGEDEKEGNGEQKKEVEKVNVGKEIVQDLMKAFQAFLDERKWKSVRYCVTLFSYMTSMPPASPVVSASSLVNLLASFVSVLDEPGLRAARGDECVRIIVEALLRLDENALAESGVGTLRDGVQAYLSSRRIDNDLFADEASKAQCQDPLEQLVTALSSASSSDADGIFPVNSVLPDVYASLTLAPAEEDETRAQAGEDPLTLPLVLVPPESDDSDITLGAAVGLEHALPPAPISAGLRGDEGVGYEGTRLTVRLFDDDTVPSDYDPAGVVVRSLIADVISLYETNRKEAATILLELPKWFKRGTFRVNKPARRPDDALDIPEEEAPEGPNWSLENLLVESILTSVLSLPAPPLTAMYYYSVLTELCRISPQTVAPSLGKSIRKLYAALGTDRDSSEESVGPVLDAEGIRRLADWFSIHLSNYGFMWGWNEWATDMDVSDKHPKRVFVKRTMDLEIRLSYFDRVKNTIPGSMLDAGVFPDDAPGPDYIYEDPEHIHNAAATSFLRMVRAKAPISEATEELDSFQRSLETEYNMTSESAENAKRDMAVQTILNVGSRSFSHFLNALERYLTLLRNLSSSPSARQHLLTTVAAFWKRHPQFHLIVLDKLLQYRLVDTRDVIAWVFTPSEAQEGTKAKTWSDPDLWQMVKITLRSVTNQIDSAKMRVEGLKREEEMKGAENDTGKQEGDDALDAEGDLPVRDAVNPELDSANSYLAEAEDEQASVLVNVLGHFAKLLPADVDEEDWETWWIKGWVREFCRSSFSHKALTSSVVADGIDKLDLATTSPATKTIFDAAKAWHSFA
ncbi:Nuclear cap-binding protein subunit 1 [Rhodotorula toruloides]